MPTYVYLCPEGHEFEKFQKINERQRRSRCPKCGRMAALQITGGAGLVFKGSGFYITDYGKGGRGGKRGKADQGEPAEKGGAEGSPKESGSKAPGTGDPPKKASE